MGRTLRPCADVGRRERSAGNAPRRELRPPHRATAPWARTLGTAAAVAIALATAAMAADPSTTSTWRAKPPEPPPAAPAAADELPVFSAAYPPPNIEAGVRALPYPRLAIYYLEGAVDESLIPRLARFNLLILNSVWTNAQLARLRQLNPDIKLYFYVCAYAITRSPYAPNQLETDLHTYASGNDLWWYDVRRMPASDWPNTYMINPTDAAPPGSQGAWRSWLVTRLIAHLDSHSQYDGIFLDNFWRSLSWAQPWLQLDSDCNPKRNAAGCNGVADAPQQLDTAWHAAMSDLAKRLRVEVDRLGKRKARQYALLSNAASDWFDCLNGTMLEHFPRSQARDPGNPYGYGWNTSMFEPRGGYLEPRFAARPFRANILNCDWSGSLAAPDRSPEFERHKRFTLGSALLGDGFYSLGSFGAVWWEPEYDLGGASPGYLGQPRGNAFRVLRPSGAEMIASGDFTTGTGAPWRFQVTGADAVLEADAAQYMQAAPSARITVRSSASPTSVKLYMAPLAIVAGQAYTLRFWARASLAQDILVHLYAETCPGSRCLGNIHFRLGKTWRQYEYSFTSTGDGAAGLNIFMGQASTVWFDDISLRAGDTAVFRRDFERGVVLLNYTNSTQTIALGEPFRRLNVPGNPTYDGTLVSAETLAPSDARILLRLPYSQRVARTPRVGAVLAVTALHPAFPNPFNPATRLAFDLALPGPVSLRLHDVAGRLVRDLLEETRPAGSHVVTWDGTDAGGRRVASGTYLCTLATADARSTIKLVLAQ